MLIIRHQFWFAAIIFLKKIVDSGNKIPAVSVEISVENSVGKRTQNAVRQSGELNRLVDAD